MRRTVALAAAALSLSFASRGVSSPNYLDDLSFLKAHLQVVELSDSSGQARVSIVPAYEGRIMTSTASGEKGASYGWINRDLIASGQFKPHMNAFGGENRLWLGPEGGPYSLFFSKEAPEESLPNWQTPALFDRLPWKVTAQAADSVQLGIDGTLTNRAGTTLQFSIARAVRLLSPASSPDLKEVELPPGVTWVGYETEDRLTNSGLAPWKKDTGMPSIWILGQFQPGPRVTIVVPIAEGSEAKLGRLVRSDYFGEISKDRLKVNPKVIYFKADGLARGKIGISPRRAKSRAGSWDADTGVLTIISFNLPKDAAKLPYVDSRWIDMPDPYAGDTVNAYNDGPPAPGVPPLGPFYEVEDSSPAAALPPGASLVHKSRTYHFTGSRASLDSLARAFLGVSLDAIEASLD